jgi:hypothetical protein
MAFNRCSLCQTTCKDLLPAWGHSYVKGICQSCGAEDPDYTPSAVVPKITLAYPTLSFEEEILMNIYFSVENEQDVLGMGLITYDTKVTEWNINNAKTVVSGYTWSEGSHLYYVTTEGIAAKCLNDTIYFAVYALLADGSYSYTGLYSYSPKTYAYNQLKTGSPEMKALVVAMLNYGAAAQNYFEYRTDECIQLVNKLGGVIELSSLSKEDIYNFLNDNRDYIKSVGDRKKEKALRDQAAAEQATAEDKNTPAAKTTKANKKKRKRKAKRR